MVVDFLMKITAYWLSLSVALLQLFSAELFAKNIRVIDSVDFRGETAEFYKTFANEPVIVRNAYPHGDRIYSFTSDEVHQMFHSVMLQVYNRADEATGWILRSLPGEAFFRDMQEGASRYFLLDQPVEGTPLEGQVHAPSFLSDNWLDSLKQSDGRPVFGLKVTLSGNKSFTRFHEDGSGEQAWMFLVYGKKRWSIYPPSVRKFIFDDSNKEFYNSRMTESEKKKRFRWEHHAAPFIQTGIAEAGDLIFVPPGWVHEVETLEESFGIGGNIVNQYQIQASVETAMVERSFALKSDFSLKKLIEDSLSNSSCNLTDEGRIQAWDALQAIRIWHSQVSNKTTDHPLEF